MFKFSESISFNNCLHNIVGKTLRYDQRGQKPNGEFKVRRILY